MVRKSLLLLACLTLISGCELFFLPSHTNPFDPAYADEDGYLLTATKSPGRLTLSWSAFQGSGFDSYIVIWSRVRQDIRAVVLKPDGSITNSTVFPLAVLTAESDTDLVVTTGFPETRHYAVIYQDSAGNRQASNIVTYEP